MKNDDISDAIADKEMIASDTDTMEEAPTITEEFEEVKNVENNNAQKAKEGEKLRVTRVSFSPLDSPMEKSSLSVSNFDKSLSSVKWDSQEVDIMATGLQAGYKGMKAREEQKLKEAEEVADMKNKEIEDKLDIDLEDPDVVKATTKIQAGFRGAMTRKSMKEKKKEPTSSRIVKTPEIVVDKGSESGSEYTYTYIEESEGEEESESLSERPDSPLTAIGGKVEMNIWLHHSLGFQSIRFKNVKLKVN